MNKQHKLTRTLLFLALALPLAAPAQETWRGLRIAPEDRCSDYKNSDYSYSQLVKDDLTALYGGVYSPYTGEWFDSDTRTDIEHIIGRSEAHDSGLCAASSETRKAFARDLLNLTLADASTNRDQKSDKDAADWLPELNRCWFANRVVAVRQKYGLNVDAQERDALEAVLSDCESADLLIYAPQAGPLSGIYTAPGGSEALLIVQDHFGETVTITLRFEAGPDGQITPAT